MFQGFGLLLLAFQAVGVVYGDIGEAAQQFHLNLITSTLSIVAVHTLAVVVGASMAYKAKYWFRFQNHLLTGCHLAICEGRRNLSSVRVCLHFPRCGTQQRGCDRGLEPHPVHHHHLSHLQVSSQGRGLSWG